MTKGRAPAGAVTVMPASRRRLRARHDGWTALRQQRFVEALARGASVQEACEAVSMSTTSAYRTRGIDSGFAAAWAQALAAIRPALDETAYQRAVIGWEEPVYYRGEVVGTRRRFSDALLRLLIQREAQVAGGSQAASLYATEEETDAALRRAIDTVKRRMRSDEGDANDDGSAFGT